MTSLGQLVLWCLSVAHDDARLEREIWRMGEAIAAAVTAPNGHAALEVLLRYLAATPAFGAPARRPSRHGRSGC